MKFVDAHHCQSPNMRGIRQGLNGIVTNPARHPDVLNDPRLRTNIGPLATYRLSFDLQLFASQMPSAAEVIRQPPDVQFILLHQGLPMDQTPEGLERWRAGLRLLAGYPNVAVKISVFGMFDHRWTPESIRPLVLTTLERFGGREGEARQQSSCRRHVEQLRLDLGRLSRRHADLSQTGKSMLFFDNALKYDRL